jgi:hypothetical protein
MHGCDGKVSSAGQCFVTLVTCTDVTGMWALLDNVLSGCVRNREDKRKMATQERKGDKGNK